MKHIFDEKETEIFKKDILYLFNKSGLNSNGKISHCEITFPSIRIGDIKPVYVINKIIYINMKMYYLFLFLGQL